ncbi:MAG: MBG domain-containing protein, partial [Limisphaerales bacterium]
MLENKELQNSLRSAFHIAEQIKVIAGFLILISSCLAASAQGVTLAWNPSPSQSAVGYNVYYGETSGDYTSSMDVGTNLNASVVGLTPGLTYYFAVNAYDVSGDESAFSNQVSNRVPILPSVVTQPLTQTAIAGTPAALSVTANGDPPLSFQWLKGFAPIAGATTSFLSWSSVAAGNAGVYSVIISNPWGCITSSVATLNVTNLQSVPLVTWANPVSIRYGTAITSSQLNATANVPGSFAYSAANGGVLSSGPHVLSVIFTPNDTVDYTSATNTVTLVVLPAPLTVIAGNANRIYGQANPSFTGSMAGVTNGDHITVAYSCSAAPGSPVGTYSIVPSAAVGADLTNYAIAYVNGALTVSPASLIITADNRTKTYGQKVAFAGTEFTAAGLMNGDTVSGVTLTCSGAAATASVAGSPYSIVPSAAVGTGLANYTIGYASGTLTVLEATSTTIWTNPLPILYGVALSSYQLNATASLPGSFAYIPANGTVLNAGTNTLSVVFTPTDTADYSSASNTVGLVVSNAPLTVTAASFSRTFGSANPVFTGSIAGLTNGDSITATYSTTATSSSPVGTYSVVPSLLDSQHRETNYRVSLINGTLTVGQGTPVLAWSNPLPITYGTALDSSQLNAAANVSGSFAYSPANGSVLNTGAHVLSVVFTPTDTVDYACVSASVSLLVASPANTIPGNGPGLSANWTFSEGAGTTVGDSSGNGNSGTLSGSPLWVSGLSGSDALEFPGSSFPGAAYVSVPNSATLADQGLGSNITICAWVKRSPASLGTYCSVVAKDVPFDSAPYHRNYELIFDTGSHVDFVYRNRGGSSWEIYSTSTAYADTANW